MVNAGTIFHISVITSTYDSNCLLFLKVSNILHAFFSGLFHFKKKKLLMTNKFKAVYAHPWMHVFASSLRWCEDLLSSSDFVYHGHVQKNIPCVFRAFFFFSWSWHVECQRGYGCQRPFLYQVIAPVWSPPLGQCAAHISSNWLTLRMPLPWNMSSWGKRDPPPSSSFLVSRQDSHAENLLVGNTQCVCICLW